MGIVFSNVISCVSALFGWLKQLCFPTYVPDEIDKRADALFDTMHYRPSSEQVSEFRQSYDMFRNNLSSTKYRHAFFQNCKLHDVNGDIYYFRVYETFPDYEAGIDPKFSVHIERLIIQQAR